MNAVTSRTRPRPQTPQACSVIAVAISLSLCLCVSPQTLAQDTSQEPILRFGVIGRSDDVQPNEFTALLLREIERLANVRIRFVPVRRSQMTKFLDEGTIDFTNLNPSLQQPSDFEFSRPHSQQALAIFRRFDSQEIVDVESLSGHTVGVRDFAALREALAGRTDAQLIPFVNVLPGLLALDRSEIDAFVCGQSRGANMVLRHEFTNIEMTAPGFMSDDTCFAARKGNHELISMLNQCLDELTRSGRLQMLIDQTPPPQLSSASWVARNRASLTLIGIIFTLLVISLGWIVLLHGTNRARKRSEQRQRQMIDELDHRVKNMLATIQAISDETLETAQSPAAFAELFRGRIASLACVHEILAQRRWRGANLQELIDQLVSPYGADDETRRFEISGEDVILPVASVLPFSLALHELATNAAKYGALSVPQGVVEIKWSLSSVDKKEVLLRWIERDGPEVAEPTHRGFGMKFIEQGIAYELGGEVTLQFDPAGLQCDMRIPI